MVNLNLFTAWLGAHLPKADARNSEKAPAYAFSSRHALAQYASTGTIHATFYADEHDQLATTLRLAADVDDAYLARTAIWARRHGHMKDMPAVLLAVLSARNTRLLEHVFPRVVDDGRMLRNFVQVVRSGHVGRTSLGSAPKRVIRTWLASRTDEQLFRASIGNRPSLADVVRMVHPRPATESRRALYAWMLGHEHESAHLPAFVRAYEAWKRDDTLPLPEVPFEMLTSVPLTKRDWRALARRSSWQQTRIHLSTFVRHGVFGGPVGDADARDLLLPETTSSTPDEESRAADEVIEEVANRLRDPVEIARARVLPHQLLVAHRHADAKLPERIRSALAEALEIATRHAPAFEGKVYVGTDVSGSMLTPLTGHRKGATTKMRAIDVAALITAVVLRRNPRAEVMPFSGDVMSHGVSADMPVFEIAEHLASLGGGGTNCSSPLRRLNARGSRGELVILVSDNESWIDAGQGRGTALLEEWRRFKRRNPTARLVCIDLQPNTTTQALDDGDILNVGGFSDHVFDLIADFAAGRTSANAWVEAIERVEL